MSDMDLKQIVLDWQQPLYSLAMRMLGQEADAKDCTQDVFVKVFQRLHQYDRSRPFKSWIYAIAQNVIMDRFRAGAKLNRHKTEYARETMVTGQHDEVEHKEREAILQQQLNDLDEESRMAVSLHYYQGMPQREVAESLGLPQSTVNKRLTAAVDRMRKGLQTAGYAAMIPGMVQGMSSSGPVAVPVELSKSLLSLSQTIQAAGVTATQLTIGGIVMTKKVLAVCAAVLLLISGTIGYSIGTVTHDADTPLIAASTTNASDDSSSVEENSTTTHSDVPDDALLLQVSQLQTDNANLLAQMQTLQADLNTKSDELEQAKIARSDVEDPEVVMLDSVDWAGIKGIVSIARDMNASMASMSPEETKEFLGSKQEELQLKGMAVMGDVMKLVAFYGTDFGSPVISNQPKALLRFVDVLSDKELSTDDTELIMETAARIAVEMVTVGADTRATALEKQYRKAQINLDAFHELGSELLTRGHDIGGLGDLFMTIGGMFSERDIVSHPEGRVAACINSMMELYGFEEDQRPQVQAVASEYIYGISQLEDISGPAPMRGSGRGDSSGMGSIGIDTQKDLDEYRSNRQVIIDKLILAAKTQRAILVFASTSQRTAIVKDTQFGGIQFLDESELPQEDENRIEIRINAGE